MGNIRNYNLDKLDFKLSNSEYFDFYLNEDAIKDVDNSNFEHLMSFDFTNLTGVTDNITNLKHWSESFSEDFEINTYGLTALDNAQLLFSSGRTLEDILLDSPLLINKEDHSLILHRVSGYTGNQTYEMGVSPEGYLDLCGGFYQGHFKLKDYNHQTLPTRYTKGWTMNFELTPSLTGCTSGSTNTLNQLYPENEGFFYYIGTRAENKFWTQFSGNTSGDTSMYTDNYASEYVKDNLDVCPPRDVIVFDPRLSGTTLSELYINDLNLSGVTLINSLSLTGSTLIDDWALSGTSLANVTLSGTSLLDTDIRNYPMSGETPFELFVSGDTIARITTSGETIAYINLSGETVGGVEINNLAFYDRYRGSICDNSDNPFCTEIRENDILLNSVYVDGKIADVSVSLSPPRYNIDEITNKFMLFGKSNGYGCTDKKTRDGLGTLTINTFDKDKNYYSVTSKNEIIDDTNKFLSFGKSNGITCSGEESDGMGTMTINEYDGDEKPKLELDKDKDIIDNAIGFRIKSDGSIGYRLLTLNKEDCKSVEVVEEYSKPNLIEKDMPCNITIKWVSDEEYDKCELELKPSRDGNYYFYANGFLIFKSKKLKEFIPKGLDEHREFQVSVPYNISIGGGTQGLLESITFDGQDPDDLGLLLEKNFAGTFIGKILSVNSFNYPMSWCEIKDKYNVRKNIL